MRVLIDANRPMRTWTQTQIQTQTVTRVLQVREISNGILIQTARLDRKLIKGTTGKRRERLNQSASCFMG